MRFFRKFIFAAALAALLGSAAGIQAQSAGGDKVWQEKARLARAQGKLDEAEAAAELAWRANPNSTEVNLFLLEIYEQNRNSKKLEGMEKLYTEGAKQAVAVGMYPFLLSHLAKDPARREQLARQAIAADPQYSWGHYGLALALAAGRASAANSEKGAAKTETGAAEIEKSLQTAIEIAPTNPRFMEALGNFYVRIGKRPEARKLFADALGLDPQNAPRYALEIAAASDEPGADPEAKTKLYRALQSVWTSYPEAPESNVAALRVLSATDADWALRKEALTQIRRHPRSDRELTAAYRGMIAAAKEKEPALAPVLAREMVATGKERKSRQLQIDGYWNQLKIAADQQNVAVYGPVVREVVEAKIESPYLYEQIALTYLDTFKNSENAVAYVKKAIATLTSERLREDYATPMKLGDDDASAARLQEIEREVRALLHLTLARAHMGATQTELAAAAIASVSPGIPAVEPYRLLVQSSIDEASDRPRLALEGLIDAYTLKPESNTKSEIKRVGEMLRLQGEIDSLMLAAVKARGRAAMPLRLVDARGAAISDSALAGKTTVVSLWGSWCAPCMTELAGLENSAKRLAEMGKASNPVLAPVTFLAVGMDSGRSGTPGFAASMPHLSFAFPADAKALAELQTKSIPRLLVFGRDGKVYYDRSGGGYDPEFATFVQYVRKL